MESDKENQEIEGMIRLRNSNKEELEKQPQELKKHNNQGYMEQMNITINEKNEQIEKLTNLYNNIYASESIAKKNNEKLIKENETLGDKIDNLKDIIARLSELL